MAAPIKSKTLVPKTAVQCGVSEELVNDVVDFFYGALRNKLDAIDDVAIRIPAIGIFKLSDSALEKSIFIANHKINNEDGVEFKSVKRIALYKALRDRQILSLTKLKTYQNEIKALRQHLGEQKKNP